MNESMRKIISYYVLIPVSVLLSTGIYSFASAAACTQTLSSGANVATAVSNAAAGSTICLNAGTYTGNVTFSKSGTASAPITLLGIGSPVIRGNVYTNGNYNVINGVTISPPTTGGGGSAVLLKGQHNTLQNCLITNYGAPARDQAVAITFDASGAYNSVIGCTIKNLNDIDVLHVFGHDQVIRNNYVTNVNQVNYALNHTDFFQTWGWPGGSAYNILVEGNVVTNSTAQLGNTETDGIATLHDITFRNNIFANIGNAFFSGVPNTKFYNNVFYRCGSVYSISYYNQTNYSSVGFEVKNNVFINTNQMDVENHSGKNTATISNNYASRGASAGFISGGDPKFVNAAGLDFHIQAGSVLIDKGATLAGFNTDKDGKTRNPPWDIGPYEFGGSTIIISPPQNLRL